MFMAPEYANHHIENRESVLEMGLQGGNALRRGNRGSGVHFVDLMHFRS